MTLIFVNSWKFGCPPGMFGYTSTSTRYGPGAGNVTVCLSRPFGPIGGCWWMMYARSFRTMIKCTPVCGPEPVLYWVSGLPLGSSTVNVTVTGRPGVTGVVGAKPPSE